MVLVVARPRASPSPSSPPHATTARQQAAQRQQHAADHRRQSRARPSPTVTAAWRPSNGSGWPSRPRPAPAPGTGRTPARASTTGRRARGRRWPASPPTTTSTSPSTTSPSRSPSAASGSSAGTPGTAATRRSSSSSTRSIDIGAGVRWLREQAGVDTVVILGNSGGGSLMGAYQSQATDPSIEPTVGPAAPRRGARPPAGRPLRLGQRPPGPARGAHRVDGSGGHRRDRPAVGGPGPRHVRPRPRPAVPTGLRRALPGRPGGPQRPHHRVGARRARAPPGGAARGTASSTCTGCGPTSGSPTSRIDPSDRVAGCYAGDPRGANFGPFAIGGTSTLRSWLSMWSLETSQCRGAPHLERITVPSLVVQSLADRGVFPSDAHAIHDALAADDKTLELRPRRALLRGHRPRRGRRPRGRPGSRAAPSHPPR